MPWTRFRSPAPALDSGWERASGVLEALVRDVALAWRHEGAVPDAPASYEATLAARALLATGERDATKDIVRAVARALAAGGADATLLPAIQRLVADFRNWTGDAEFLARHAEGLGRLAGFPEPAPQGLVEASPDTAVGWGLVGDIVERRFGLEPRAAEGRLAVRPALPPEWPGMELTGIRVGRTALDLRVRRRADLVIVRLSRVHGPSLRLEAALPDDAGVRQVYVDDEPLGIPRATFQLSTDHELRFETA